MSIESSTQRLISSLCTRHSELEKKILEMQAAPYGAVCYCLITSIKLQKLRLKRKIEFLS